MALDIFLETNQYRYIRNFVQGIETIYVQDKRKRNRVYISGESLARYIGYRTLEAMFLNDNILDRLNDRRRVKGFFPVIIINESELKSKR
jgi:hypothetical protein